MEQQNKSEKANFKLILDGKKYEWPHQFITGAEVRNLSGVSSDFELYFKIKGAEDNLILPESNIDLSNPGNEHFYSRQMQHAVSIIVNGRPKPWHEQQITFEQVIILAFGSYVENPNRVFTATYKGGPSQNPEGTMVKGDKVFVKNKMVFNVTATDKS